MGGRLGFRGGRRLRIDHPTREREFDRALLRRQVFNDGHAHGQERRIDRRLDGDARFSYPSPMVYRVAPEDVRYTVTSPTAAAATRAWVEKECFCTPTSLGGTQRLTGELRIERASGRLRGRVSLRAEGTISPTTWRSERVDLATQIDLPDPS